MRGVIPYLTMAGKAGEAADFYGKAFAATDLGRMEMPEQPGQFMHVQIEINGGSMMMTDHGMNGEGQTVLEGAHLQLVVDNGSAWWDRAVAAGCTVVAPFEKQFWGDQWGLLADPFGIHWAILEPDTAAQS
jgi:PhnB protein